jgi:predicted DNA-binding protein
MTIGNGTTQTTILIPVKLAEKLHMESFQTHQSKSSIIRSLLEAHYREATC